MGIFYAFLAEKNPPALHGRALGYQRTFENICMISLKVTKSDFFFIKLETWLPYSACDDANGQREVRRPLRFRIAVTEKIPEEMLSCRGKNTARSHVVLDVVQIRGRIVQIIRSCKKKESTSAPKVSSTSSFIR
jgi:hypothetical protein